MMFRILPALAIAVAVNSTAAAQDAQGISTDVVIYGGTASGAATAIQTARMGKSVIIVEPSKHLGGLTSGGLGWTDSGNKNVIGGISREFYQFVKKHYDQDDAWVHEKRDTYKFYRANEDAMWTFEPKVAEQILRDMLKEHNIEVLYGERLNRNHEQGIRKADGRIRSITLESGKVLAGKMFIDATYEGDLMALAGVSYTVGREANDQYGETLNGVARKWNTHLHRFVVKVDPYVKPGDPKSGLLHGIDPMPLPKDGEADKRVQAYCFRMCMSDVPENRVPFPKPKDFDESKYELLFRNFEAGDMRLPLKIDRMPNGKTDTNNNCAVSTDYIGQNYDFPEASYEERERIFNEHVSYQQGLMWCLANHPRVPVQTRKNMAKWGLAKDEFTDFGNWPHQMYVREARRMVGEYVHTELDCRRTRQTPMSVGMGSYNMDSHNCARYITPEGYVQNEGDVQVSPGGPYKISYQSITPKKADCENLLVPVCVSSSHIAYGSIRMEPVFMILGQSAATAACFAIDDGIAVQEVGYDKLREKLLADKQVLEFEVPPRPAPIDPKKLPGIVVDDDATERRGFVATSSSISPFVGTGYRHDDAKDRGSQSASYRPKIDKAGKYEVRMSYSPNQNRATNVQVTITHANGETVKKVNQRVKPPIDGLWVSLGEYEFEAGTQGSVVISNADANGHVVIDAVQWLPKK